MKKITASLAFASTLAITSFAFADETRTSTVNSNPTRVQAGATATTPGATMQQQPVQTTTMQSSTTSAAATTPAATTPSSTTTLTSADDSSITPLPPSSSGTLSTGSTSNESVTVYKHNRPNKPLLFTGVGILAGTYATTAAITAANSETNDKSLYIPVVGPWLTLAGTNDYSSGKTLLIAGSGALQGIGAGLAIASFFIPEKVAAATISAGNVKMNVTPTSVGGGGGIGAVGTF